MNNWRYAEDTVCEYKVSLETAKPKSWLKTVSAFANGIGGSIYFGIDDNKNVVGVDRPTETIDKISEYIKQYIEPIINPAITQFEESGKVIVEVTISAQKNTPYYCTITGKEAYIRMGSQSVVAESHILNELVLRGKGLTFDAASSQTKFGEVSFTLFEATYLKGTGNPIDKNRDYTSFLLKDSNDHLTNAGLLFADQCGIYQSRIFCTRWNGLKKASGTIDALDDKEYSGNIISLINNTKEFIKNNSKVKWRKTGNGRVDLPDYPEAAVPRGGSQCFCA